ncbi:PKD domain-containing protein [Candidatus Bathyarchaeota archaeon]|nr:MAG: PKD domain-containing protein [Candidatus Bathyarchaeota archaeon]
MTLLLLTLTFSVPHTFSATAGFSFASAGDAATLTSGDGMNSLSRLSTSATDFFFGLGDYSYSSSTAGDVWCSQFKAQYNNIEIGPGNHDTGEVTDVSGTRSYERYVAGCSYTLASQVACGPVTGQCYGKEYYFDYPSTSPVARFIMISPRVFNITGVCTTTCNAVVGSPCNDTNGCWPYNTKDLHWNWTAKAIDSARTAGIRWVIVGMHKVCISAGAESCNIGTNLFNMLVSKKVDLILEGHDHTYERSKQLGFNSACTAFTTNSSYVVYNSNCVVDDGSRGFYTAGAGTVVVIGGTFGSGFSTVNDPAKHPANAAEAPYFVSLMGSNTPGNGHGFLVYSVSAARIDIQSNFAGTYQDSFSIVSSTAPLSASFTYAPASPSVGSQVTFTATSSGGTQPYSFSWAFGDGSTGTGATATHAYATAGSYTVVLTVKDSASPQQTVTSQQTVTVTNPPPPPLSASFTFSPSSPQTNQQVTFTASAAGGTAPYSFGWTFGDGSTGTGSTATHAYASAGTFTVVLTVRDNGSPQQTATSQQSLTVTNPPPPALTASFTFSPTSPSPMPLDRRQAPLKRLLSLTHHPLR